jgi:hypothetical protein
LQEDDVEQIGYWQHICKKLEIMWENVGRRGRRGRKSRRSTKRKRARTISLLHGHVVIY